MRTADCLCCGEELDQQVEESKKQRQNENKEYKQVGIYYLRV